MKAHWMNWRMLIIEDQSLSAYAKLIALYLNTYMNDRQSIAFPSVDTIKKDLNISGGTVVKYTEELVEYGYLNKQKRFSNSVIYTILVPDRYNSDSILPDRKLEDASILSDETQYSTTQNTVFHDVESNNQFNKQSNNQVIELPPQINPEAFTEWDEYRRTHKTKKVRDSWTPKAAQLTINKLKKLSHQQQADCIHDSIMNGYQGLFPEKFNRRKSNEQSDFNVLESIARFGQAH